MPRAPIISSLGICVLEALTLASAGLSPRSADATTIVAPPQGPTPKSPSAWLKRARGHWIRGEFEASGDAYAEALSSMAPRKQHADEGAQAVLLAIDAYWSAYEASGSVEILQRALSLCETWIGGLEPSHDVSMVPQVQRAVARLRAVADPIGNAQAALEENRYLEAADAFETAAIALQTQERPWSTQALIVLAASDAHAAAFERALDEEGDTARFDALERSIELLEQWSTRRPQDDRSAIGTELVQRLAERQAWLEELRRQRRAHAKAEVSPPEPVVAPAPAERDEPHSPLASPVVAYTLLPVGIASLAGGAVLVTLGAMAMADADATSADLRDDPAYGALTADRRAAFDRELSGYEDASTSYGYATIISGSALAAGGVAMTVIGAIALHQVRGRRASERVSGRERSIVVLPPRPVWSVGMVRAAGIQWGMEF